MATLKIENLHADANGHAILKGLSLTVESGKTHAIMGPNGTGKSTLASVIMGHPKYRLTKGTITFDGQDIEALSTDERARLGLFLAMQSPAEVPGVTNSEFVKAALDSRRGEEDKSTLFTFVRAYEKAVKELKMDVDLPHRHLNDGVSGGEKKRNEILQMKMLEPRFAILDEIDSGLDVDALKIVGENVTAMKNDDLGLLVITHYQRLLDYIKPDVVHVMMQGRIVISGGVELIEEIDAHGYEGIKKRCGIKDERVHSEEKSARISLEPSAASEAAKKR